MSITVTGRVLRARSGWSELVIEHDIDGRLRISVHDETGPGVTADFDQASADRIADFIKEPHDE